MQDIGKPEIWIQMVMPGTAAVQATLTGTPASVTLRTAHGVMRVAVSQTFSDDSKRLTRAQHGR